jgi:hypothetical protein
VAVSSLDNFGGSQPRIAVATANSKTRSAPLFNWSRTSKRCLFFISYSSFLIGCHAKYDAGCLNTTKCDSEKLTMKLTPVASTFPNNTGMKRDATTTGCRVRSKTDQPGDDEGGIFPDG